MDYSNSTAEMTAADRPEGSNPQWYSCEAQLCSATAWPVDRKGAGTENEGGSAPVASGSFAGDPVARPSKGETVHAECGSKTFGNTDFVVLGGPEGQPNQRLRDLELQDPPGNRPWGKHDI